MENKTVRTVKEAMEVIAAAGLNISEIGNVADYASKVVSTFAGTNPVQMSILLSLSKFVAKHFDPKSPVLRTGKLGKLNSRIVMILKREGLSLADLKKHINDMDEETSKKIEAVAKKPVRTKKAPAAPPTPPADAAQ